MNFINYFYMQGGFQAIVEFLKKGNSRGGRENTEEK